MSHIQGETVAEVETQVASRMKKTLGDLQREMATIRTGKASPTILDGVRVSYYGTPTPLNQLANLSAPEPSLILVQPWDVSQIREIEKAIMSSDLGLNPSNDGKAIRIAIPPLTEERRKELVKHLHHVVEHHRVAARAVRHEANDAVKRLEKRQEDLRRRSTPRPGSNSEKDRPGHRRSRQGRRSQGKRDHGDRLGPRALPSSPPRLRRTRGSRIIARPAAANRTPSHS